MGNFVSKIIPHYESKAKSLPNEQYCTPPQHNKRVLPIDPRSATAGIPRTPIEVNSPVDESKSVSAIPKYLQTKRFLETDLDFVIPPLNLDPLDPRSPTVNYPRTPIVVDPKSDSSSKEIDVTPKNRNTTTKINPKNIDPRSPATDFARTPILTLHNNTAATKKALDNVKQDDRYPKLFYCETTTDDSSIPPEIHALPDLVATTLNETEVFDKSTIDSCNCSFLTSTKTVFDKTQEITVIFRPQREIDTIAEAKVESQDEMDKTETKDDVMEEVIKTAETEIGNIFSSALKIIEETAQPKEELKVWRDSLSPRLPVDETLIGDRTNVKSPTLRAAASTAKGEVLIEFDDDAKTKIDTSKGKVEKATRKRKNSRLEIASDKNAEGAEKKSSETSKLRTPLRNRSNSHGQLQSKSPQRSHLAKTQLFTTFQENTPPNKKKLLAKTKGTKWDANKTVVI